MNRSLSTSAADYTVLGWLDGGRELDALPFEDAMAARGFLSQFVADPLALSVLRELAAEGAAGAEVSSWDDDEVLSVVAERLAERSLRIAPDPRVLVLGKGGEETSFEPPKDPEPTLASITYQVVDDATGDPIEGITLFVTLPGGDEKEKKTDAEGFVKFEKIKHGRCRVRAERGDEDLLHVLIVDGFGLHRIRAEGKSSIQPWERPTVEKLKHKLVREADDKKKPTLTSVRPHRVRTGDTLASIAEKYEMSEDALVKFNFGTTDEKEVQRLLVREVGCRHKNLKTGEFVLHDHDKPGIVWIPVPFAAEWQATERDWVIRVHRHVPVPKAYVFSL